MQRQETLVDLPDIIDASSRSSQAPNTFGSHPREIAAKPNQYRSQTGEEQVSDGSNHTEQTAHPFLIVP